MLKWLRVWWRFRVLVDCIKLSKQESTVPDISTYPWYSKVINHCYLSQRKLVPSSRRRHGPDKTVLSCLVRVGGVNWTDDKSRLSETENFETNMFSFFAVLPCLEMRCELSFVLSRPSFQFATVQSQIYRGLLKTVLTCRQFSLHRRHGKARQPCLVRMSSVWTRHYESRACENTA